MINHNGIPIYKNVVVISFFENRYSGTIPAKIVMSKQTILNFE